MAVVRLRVLIDQLVPVELKELFRMIHIECMRYHLLRRHGSSEVLIVQTIRTSKVRNATLRRNTGTPKEHDIIDGTELNKFLDGLIYAEQKIRLNGYETRTDIIERIKIKADSLTIIKANKGDSED